MKKMLANSLKCRSICRFKI